MFLLTLASDLYSECRCSFCCTSGFLCFIVAAAVWKLLIVRCANWHYNLLIIFNHICPWFNYKKSQMHLMAAQRHKIAISPQQSHSQILRTKCPHSGHPVFGLISAQLEKPRIFSKYMYRMNMDQTLIIQDCPPNLHSNPFISRCAKCENFGIIPFLRTQ